MRPHILRSTILLDRQILAGPRAIVQSPEDLLEVLYKLFSAMRTEMPKPGSKSKERESDTAPSSKDQYQAIRPISIHD